MTRPLDPHTLRQVAARWPQETLSSRAARSFLQSLVEEEHQQPATGLAELAQRLHDAACGCGETLAGTWSSYWLTIARAATRELQQ